MKNLKSSEIDWNAIWKTEIQEDIKAVHGGECWTAWDGAEAAEKYSQRSACNPRLLERIDELKAWLPPQGRALDIGAGPGNIAIPLSPFASMVTAVEPAKGMGDILARERSLANASNVHLVRKRWDDVDPAADLSAPYDLTFCSFALGMLDLCAAIDKMIQVTHGQIVIYWHAGHQEFDREASELYRLLYQAEHKPIPKVNILFNLLYEMGIFPNVKSSVFEWRGEFGTFEDAMKDYQRRFPIKTEKQRKSLETYLSRKLISENGKYVSVGRGNSMRVSWSTIGQNH